MDVVDLTEAYLNVYNLNEENLDERTFYGKQYGSGIQTTGPRRSGTSSASNGPDLDAMRVRFRKAEEEEKNKKQKPRLPSRGISASEPVLRGGKKRKPGGTAQQRVATLQSRMRSGGDSQEMRDRVNRLKTAIKKKKKWGTPQANEEFIMNYLIDEGYANTIESAKAIMYNMSESWINSILTEEESLADMLTKLVHSTNNKAIESENRIKTKINNIKKKLDNADRVMDRQDKNGY